MIDIQHVQQPKKSNQCGQACIASLVGITLQQAIELVGEKGATTARDITKALKIRGTRRRLQKGLGDLPLNHIPCLLSLKIDNSSDWHWALLYNSEQCLVIMDPEKRMHWGLKEWLKDIALRHGRVTSYLDLSKYKRSTKMTEAKARVVITENQKCELTPEEISEASEKMAQKMGALRKKEAEKKEVTSQFKADIDALGNDVDTLAQMVRNKFVYRDVEVSIEPDATNKTMVYTRLDTGEVIRERAMTPSELQTELELN